MRFAVLITGVFLFAAAPATAAQRFASPSGAGNCSNQVQACSLTTAVEGAAANDEVIVGAGTYNVATDIDGVVSNLTVHGDTSGPMPNIVGGVGAVLVLNLSNVGSTVSYLKISDVGFGAPLGVLAGDVSRVDLSAEDTGLSITGPCSVKDSLIRTTGPGTVSVIAGATGGSPTCVMRNITAISTGTNTVGVQARALSLATAGINLDARNVIAQGERADIEAVSDGGFLANATVTNSNFVDLVSNGGSINTSANQSAPPLFVNAAAGDFREAAGSPTIDAGVIDQVGPLDLAGNLRTINGTVDIGAYEFIPAPASAPAPTPTTDTPAKPSSKVSGKVKLRKKKSKLTVLSGIKFTCAAACTVEGAVAKTGKTRSAASRVLGKVKTSVKAGATAEVTIALSKKGAATLRKARKLKVKITASAKDTLGRKADASRSATIKAPKRK